METTILVLSIINIIATTIQPFVLGVSFAIKKISKSKCCMGIESEMDDRDEVKK